MTKALSPSPKALRKAFRAEKTCPLFVFELGDEAKDRITGFKGILISRVEHLNGCIRYELQTQKLTEDGKINCLWFDEAELKRTGPGINKGKKAAPKEEGPGGPKTAPPAAFHTPR